MPSCSHAIIREVNVGVYVVHRLNPLSVHFVYFSFLTFTRSACIVHDGDNVYRRHLCMMGMTSIDFMDRQRVNNGSQ